MKTILLYDGECNLCIHSTKIIKNLDWLSQIILRDARKKATFKGLPKISQKDALTQMQAVNGTKVYSGFFAFRHISWKIPLFWILAPFLYIPGAEIIGSAIYRVVANNRFGVYPKCTNESCELHLNAKKKK